MSVRAICDLGIAGDRLLRGPLLRRNRAVHAQIADQPLDRQLRQSDQCRQLPPPGAEHGFGVLQADLDAAQVDPQQQHVGFGPCSALAIFR